MGASSYQHRARSGCRLHAICDIGCLAEDVRTLAYTRANDDFTRIDTDPRGQLWVCGVLVVNFRHRRDNGQTRTRSALGIIVVRLGPAEVGHHAVTLVLRDVTSEPLDSL